MIESTRCVVCHKNPLFLSLFCLSEEYLKEYPDAVPAEWATDVAKLSNDQYMNGIPDTVFRISCPGCFLSTGDQPTPDAAWRKWDYLSFSKHIHARQVKDVKDVIKTYRLNLECGQDELTCKTEALEKIQEILETTGKIESK